MSAQNGEKNLFNKSVKVLMGDHSGFVMNNRKPHAGNWPRQRKFRRAQKNGWFFAIVPREDMPIRTRLLVWANGEAVALSVGYSAPVWFVEMSSLDDKPWQEHVPQNKNLTLFIIKRVTQTKPDCAYPTAYSWSLQSSALIFVWTTLSQGYMQNPIRHYCDWCVLPALGWKRTFSKPFKEKWYKWGSENW